MILTLVMLFFATGCNEEKANEQQETSIFGSWRLISFVNDSDGTSLDASNPDYYDPINNSEISIIINFKEDFEYEGATSSNTFSGDYNLGERNRQLILQHFLTTKAGETKWGDLFYDSFDLSYDQQSDNWKFIFEIQGDTLKIFYEDYDYMTFKKL